MTNNCIWLKFNQCFWIDICKIRKISECNRKKKNHSEWALNGVAWRNRPMKQTIRKDKHKKWLKIGNGHKEGYVKTKDK